MRKKLRICVIAYHFAPTIGGSEIQAEKHARQLQAFGHDVTVITLRREQHWKKVEDYEGLPVYRIGGIYRKNGTLRLGRLGHIPSDILLFQLLWKLRKEFDGSHSLQMSPLAGVAAFIGQKMQIPLVVSIPSAGPTKVPRPEDATLMADTLKEKGIDTAFLRVPFQETVVGDIDVITRTAIGGKAILNYLKQSDTYYQVLSTRSHQLLAAKGFKTDHIFPLPNGIDIDKFCPNPNQRSHVEQPERDLLCVARLEFPKGVDILLHAWGRMMNEDDQWRAHLKPRLLLAGDGTLRAQLQRIVQELGIEESVVFLGSHKDVVPLLQQAWGFVLPSRWEGMPNALLEAMACGLPSIATRVSGSEDIIQDGINGLLVEPEDPIALAQAMRKIIHNHEAAQQFAKAGRDTIVQQYQLNHITKRCEDFYYQVLNTI